VKQFTDFPLLMRTDTSSGCAPPTCSGLHAGTLPADGPSKKVQNITDEQYAKLGDYVVWDEKPTVPRR
jgi:hypothetical protein